MDVSPGSLDDMPLSEFNRWQNYLSFGTFLERLLDHHLAQITTLLFNANFTPKRKVQDFLLLAQPPRPQPSADALWNKMLFMNAALGGTVIDGRKN